MSQAFYPTRHASLKANAQCNKLQMIINEQADGTNVILGSGTGARARIMFMIQALVSVLIFIGCCVAAVSAFRQEKIVLGLVVAVIAGGVLIACWRLLSKVTGAEELLIMPDALRLTRFANGRKNIATYPIESIQNLCYTGAGTVAYHPLQSDNLDALGFGVRQNMVHAVTAEGNVAFYFGTKQIRFGINLSSWDTEQLNSIIKEKTGGKLDIAGLPEDIPDSVWNR